MSVIADPSIHACNRLEAAAPLEASNPVEAGKPFEADAPLDGSIWSLCSLSTSLRELPKDINLEGIIIDVSSTDPIDLPALYIKLLDEPPWIQEIFLSFIWDI